MNFNESAPTSVLENTSNKFKGTFLALMLFGFIPNCDSLKLNLDVDNDVCCGLLLSLKIFFDFSNIL